MIFYYIRHADPIYDPDSLTPLGYRQAEALGRRLSSFGLDEIYVSSSNRAKLTAQPTCEMLRMEPTVLDWCNEKYAWQDFTMQTEDGRKTWAFNKNCAFRTFTSPEMTALGQKWYEHPLFNGTNFKLGYQRILNETYAFFAKQGYIYEEETGLYRCEAPNEKRIALFAHHGFGLAFLSALLGIPYPFFCTHFDICHTGVSVIHFDSKGKYTAPVMWEHSSNGHLYKEGLPLLYNYEERI